MVGSDTREDFEFSLHHVLENWKTFRSNAYTMDKPQTAGVRNVGGLKAEYVAGRHEIASKLIHAKYPDITTLERFTTKKGVTVIEGELDVRVDWKMFQ
jgi:hypothetical protein